MEAISKSTLDFLKSLKNNNNREWFNQNKEAYLEARRNYESFVQEFIDRIVKFDPVLKGLEAPSCTYRINRDIRFSNDKSPYKSHFGAFVVKGGKQNGDKYAGYYFHVEPGNSLFAGGAYMPPAPWLASIREKIDDEGERLAKIINAKEFKSVFGSLEGEKLKTAPKGFPKDHPYIDLLRMKSYLVEFSISDKEVVSEECMDKIVRGAKVMKTLNDFLNEY
ncbi:MAG TPA: DUF2461 domain-containing protein [Bacteroidales bacterium]|nr:DUF2461 domain-containing protein [Bacteroidales bacterium]